MDEPIVGVDFRGPGSERQQRRKILAVAALRLGQASLLGSATRPERATPLAASRMGRERARILSRRGGTSDRRGCRRLDPWRSLKFWSNRVTDVAAGAQPPPKHQYQVLYDLALLGNAFLALLQESGRFDVVPFQNRGRAAPVLEGVRPATVHRFCEAGEPPQFQVRDAIPGPLVAPGAWQMKARC